MSDNTTFMEDVYERYWGRFVADCEESQTRPSTSDFLVWLDDNDLIPEVDYEKD